MNFVFTGSRIETNMDTQASRHHSEQNKEPKIDDLFSSHHRLNGGPPLTAEHIRSKLRENQEHSSALGAAAPMASELIRARLKQTTEGVSTARGGPVTMGKRDADDSGENI